MKNREYYIPFSGLKEGKHQFEFAIDNTFFNAYDFNDFNTAELNIHVTLKKLSTMMELAFEASGSVRKL